VLWRTPTSRHRLSNIAVSFSPDGKRVVMVSGDQVSDYEWPWDIRRQVRVRDARTGRLLSTFTGNFAVARTGDVNDPVWETARTLLLHATSDLVRIDGEVSFPHASVIRCSTVTASCVKVPIAADDALLVRRSN
jgi:hypothetical protein